MSQHHPGRRDREAAAVPGAPDQPSPHPTSGPGGPAETTLPDRGEDQREKFAVAALTLVHQRLGEAVLTIITDSSQTAAYQRTLAEVFACLVHAEPVLQTVLPDVWRTCQAAAGAIRTATDGGDDTTVLRSELLAVQQALHHYLVNHDVPPADLAVLNTGQMQQQLLAPLADGPRLRALMPARRSPDERAPE